jgi:hypothetical protein
MYRAVLDISAHLVHLDSPIYGKVSLQLSPVARLQAFIYTIDAKSWLRYLWFVNIQRYFLMIYWECLLIGPSNSRSSCSLVLPLSISDHIL